MGKFDNKILGSCDDTGYSTYFAVYIKNVGFTKTA